jgi:hypothetical protein
MLKLNQTKRPLVAVMTPEGQRKVLTQQLIDGLDPRRPAAPAAPKAHNDSNVKTWLHGYEMAPAPQAVPVIAPLQQTSVRMEGQVHRSVRGSIEMICHPTGTMIKPKFQAGLLMSVEFEDGSRFIRSNGVLPWQALDSNGNFVEELQIATLSIDKAGVISYITVDGAMTVIGIDGSVDQIAA